MTPPPVPGPTEGLNAAVAAQIRAEAAAAKLTDKALAEKADLKYSSLRRWLGKDVGRERHIDLAVLGALSTVLGIPPAEIIRRAQERAEFFSGDNEGDEGTGGVLVPLPDRPSEPPTSLPAVANPGEPEPEGSEFGDA